MRQRADNSGEPPRHWTKDHTPGGRVERIGEFTRALIGGDVRRGVAAPIAAG
jgi:hypothetical protein